MKKMIIALLLVLTISIPAMAAGGWDFDYGGSYGNGGSYRVSGNYEWADANGLHGCATITITDSKGNSISWDVTFSDTEVWGNTSNDEIINDQYPEIDRELLDYVNNQPQ